MHFYIKSVRANLYYKTLAATWLGFLSLLVHTGTHFIMLISLNKTDCGFTNQRDERTTPAEARALLWIMQLCNCSSSPDTPPASATPRAAHSLFPDRLALDSGGLWSWLFDLLLVSTEFRRQRYLQSCNNSNYRYTPEGNHSNKTNQVVFTGIVPHSLLFSHTVCSWY